MWSISVHDFRWYILSPRPSAWAGYEALMVSLKHIRKDCPIHKFANILPNLSLDVLNLVRCLMPGDIGDGVW
jgi:hypothetical protein